MRNIAEEQRLSIRRKRLMEKSGVFIALLVINSSILLLLGTLIIYHIAVTPVESSMTFVKVKAVPPPPKPPKRGGEGQKSMLDPTVQIVPPQSSAPVVINSSAASLNFNIPNVAAESVPNLPSLAPPSGAGSASGSAGGGVPQTSPFGNVTDDSSGSTGLVGILYDFTRDVSNQPTHVGKQEFGNILHQIVDNSWQTNAPRYTSPNKLCITHLFYPITKDENAGTAFQSPESSHAFWVVHYQGAINIVSSSLSGRCRFVGFGDNVLFVAINGNIVLDASDLQYLHRQGDNKRIGTMSFPNGGKPIFSGDWINLDQGTTYKIDILIGDEGGVTTAGLFLQTEGASITFASNGAPKLPLFSIGDIADSDQQMLSKWLPPECFQQTIVIKSESSDAASQ